MDVDAARFQWHIGSLSLQTRRLQLTAPGGHAAFQAIMHVLSELRNPLFDAPDRQRALRALQLSRLLKENNHTKPWQAVKSMIDKVVGENMISRSSQSESSSSFVGPPAPTSIPMTSSVNPSFPAFTEQLPAFPTPGTSQPVVPQPVSQPVQTQPLQQMQPLDQTQFNWDDLNFSNIVGDVQNNTELPEFDFVSIGFLSYGTKLTLARASGAIQSILETSQSRFLWTADIPRHGPVDQVSPVET